MICIFDRFATDFSGNGMLYAADNYGNDNAFPIPAATVNTAYIIQLEAASRTVVRIGTSSRTWRSGFIILEYTKTTG